MALISRKGGSGKTTLAVALAVAHEQAGGVAVVVDLDPQGSARTWSELRRHKSPPAPRRSSVFSRPPVPQVPRWPSWTPDPAKAAEPARLPARPISC